MVGGRRLTIAAALSVPVVIATATNALSQKGESLPLQPTRRVVFKATEGSWLSLDVSPDGSVIVFELLGDLYRVPIQGGHATRLTEGLPFDAQPRFSPDGKYIAYISDAGGSDQLWVMNSDGTSRHAVSEGRRRLFASPQWLPDGRFIAVSRARRLGPYELWLYHRDGGSGVQLTKAADANVLGAAPSHDGRYIYYSSRKGTLTWNIRLPLWQVSRLDVLTGEEEALTDLPGSALRPVLSPDGTGFAYGTRVGNRTELRLRSLVTGEDRLLTDALDHDAQESDPTRDLLPGYAFTPDGQYVVIGYGGQIHRIRTDSGVDVRVPFDADVDVPAGPLLDAPLSLADRTSARLIENGSESPDGQLLVFSALNRIYLADGHGRSVRRLTSADVGEFQPSWSPDGQWIVYVTWDGTEGGLWKIARDGGPPVRLSARRAYFAEPAFTANGQRVAVLLAAEQARATQEGGVYKPIATTLAWVPASGGEPVVITEGSDVGPPQFTREDDRVYFTTPKGLVSTRFDGSDRRPVASVLVYHEPDPAPADDLRISPDGGSLLVVDHSRISVIPIPRVAEPTLTVNLESPSVPVRRLSGLGGAGVRWTHDGMTATWTLGSSYFRMPLSASSADEIKVSVPLSPRPAGDALVLRGATIVTMHGDDVVSPGDVVIRGNRIEGVGVTGDIGVPSGATIVDVSGDIVLPGFIDTHSHMASQTGLKGIRDPQPWPYAANLAYGVTTTRDPQANTTDVFVYQDLVDLGRIVGPRVLSTGPGVFGGGFFGDVNLKTLDDARDIARRYKEYYQTNTIKSYLVGDRRDRQFMVTAGRELGIRMTTEGAGDVKLDLTHAMDGYSGNEHNLPLFPIYQDVIQLFAQTHIAYTPTLTSGYGGPEGANYFLESEDLIHDPKVRRFVPPWWIDRNLRRRPWVTSEEYVLAAAAKGAAEISHAGGTIAVGSHSKLEGLGFHWEMWALEMGGLTPTEVLRAATVGGADVCGISSNLGSLEKGKLADLVIFERDPRQNLKNSTTIRYVLKDGVLYDAATMDEVWPTRKPWPVAPWQ
jgi:Tol biopolymer transport system component